MGVRAGREDATFHSSILLDSVTIHHKRGTQQVASYFSTHFLRERM